ncbi:unnamed protein product [marine sediment metagenome]|uniref:Uncharacterized protein n=1 Tax=marine sediment metagenome TaxID=412755 RepID=X1DD71_9ZZZZ
MEELIKLLRSGNKSGPWTHGLRELQLGFHHDSLDTIRLRDRSGRLEVGEKHWELVLVGITLAERGDGLAEKKQTFTGGTYNDVVKQAQAFVGLT